MKKTTIVLLGLILSFGIFGSFAGAEGEGHFALFQGKYSHYDAAQGAYVVTDAVFYLDTVTGDVYVLVSSSDDRGRRVRYWEPLNLDETKTPTGF